MLYFNKNYIYSRGISGHILWKKASLEASRVELLKKKIKLNKQKTQQLQKSSWKKVKIPKSYNILFKTPRF